LTEAHKGLRGALGPSLFPGREGVLGHHPANRGVLKCTHSQAKKSVSELVDHTLYTNTHEQQPYCVGTLSQMRERSAERRVRQETGWLAGGPLLRVATIRHTTDTFLFISHTTNVLLLKFHCNIFIGVRIIKEMSGLIASGTLCNILVIFYIYHMLTRQAMCI